MTFSNLKSAFIHNVKKNKINKSLIKNKHFFKDKRQFTKSIFYTLNSFSILIEHTNAYIY